MSLEVQILNNVLYMYIKKPFTMDAFIPRVNAPIKVKLEEGGGGGRATHGNLTVTCIPRVEILIILIVQLQRAEDK